MHYAKLLPALTLIAAACLAAGCATHSASNTVELTSTQVPRPESSSSSSGGGPELVVMSQVTVRDASGAVIATPRMCTELDKPGRIQLTSKGAPVDVQVVARRSAGEVVVDATLRDGNGRTVQTASVRAKPPQPEGGF